MIQKAMAGRLGNQMFQYATLRAYMIKNNENNLCLDFNSIIDIMGNNNELKNFNVIEYKEILKPKYSFIQKILNKITNIMVKVYAKTNKTKQIKLETKLNPILQKFGIFKMSYGYVEFKASKCKNKVFTGYFESPKYFDEIRDTLLQEFQPKYDKLEKNLKVYEEMDKTESVCMAIRRGDYLKEENKGLLVCTLNYYEKALETMLKLKPDSKFFVFSDDIEWVKQNLKFPEGTYFESGNDPVWETLRLMSSCKNFIISNSTFNWWAQYLSTNDKKIVIAPNRWRNTFESPEIYQDNWILIQP